MASFPPRRRFEIGAYYITQNDFTQRPKPCYNTSSESEGYHAGISDPQRSGDRTGRRGLCARPAGRQGRGHVRRARQRKDRLCARHGPRHGADVPRLEPDVHDRERI